MKKIFFTFTVCLIGFAAQAKLTVYVDKNVSGANSTGLSWENAHPTINSAIQFAEVLLPFLGGSGVNILVAHGEYNESIILREGISLYGGFDGAITGDPPLRTNIDDPYPIGLSASPTIINGGSTTAIAIYDGITRNTVLDGFVITGGGNSNATGIFCNGGSATLRNLAIKNCIGGRAAVRIATTTASPFFANCIFSGNYNTGPYGNSDNRGSAVFIRNTGSDGALFVNCLFSGNKLDGGNGGGTVSQRDASFRTSVSAFINCTFAGNDDGNNAQATFDYWDGTANLYSCLFYGNSANSYRISQTSGVVQNCIMQGKDSESDPLFKQPILYQNAPTSDGDYSVCLKTAVSAAGDASIYLSKLGISANNLTDLAGQPRVMGANIEIGAYEMIDEDNQAKAAAVQIDDVKGFYRNGIYYDSVRVYASQILKVTYTTDGSQPTVNSQKFPEYGLLLTKTTNLRLGSFDSCKFSQYLDTSFNVLPTPKLPAPKFNLLSGNHHSSIDLELSCDTTTDAEIYYQIDDDTWTLYTESLNLTAEAGYTVRAVAVGIGDKDFYYASDTVKGLYRLTNSSVAAQPILSTNGGRAVDSIRVYIQSENNTSFFYTLDGSSADTSVNKNALAYTEGGILVQGASGSTVTLHAAATKENAFSSPEVVAEFNFVDVIPSASGVVYVDENTSGKQKTGESWEYAISDLAKVINLSRDKQNGIKKVFVAAGTYKPRYCADGQESCADSREKTFVLADSVEYYGGFATPLPAKNVIPDFGAVGRNGVTILSGDIDNNGALDEGNAYHVLAICGLSNKTLLDGFTVTGGFANSANNGTDINGYENIRQSGAGIYLHSAAAAMNNLNITGNAARQDGGGLYAFYSNNAQIANSAINNNKAGWGAGAYNRQNGTFYYTNVLISGNKADNKGGALHLWEGNPQVYLTNVTIAGNSNPNAAAAVSLDNGNCFIRNAIIYGNQGNSLNTTNNISVYSSLVQGRKSTSNGNINGSADPRFAQPFSFNDAPVAGGDYSILSCSPAINSGSNDYVNGISKDLAGNDRVQSKAVDMGCYESSNELILMAPPKFTVAGDYSGAADSVYFDDRVFVTLSCDTLDAILAYSVDGGDEQPYSDGFWVKKSQVIRASATQDCHEISFATAKFYTPNRPDYTSITLPYSEVTQYNTDSNRYVHYGWTDAYPDAYAFTVDKDTAIQIKFSILESSLPYPYTTLFLFKDSIVNPDSIAYITTIQVYYTGETGQIAVDLAAGRYYLHIITTGQSGYYELSVSYTSKQEFKYLPIPVDTSVVFDLEQARYMNFSAIGISTIYPAYSFKFTLPQDTVIRLELKADYNNVRGILLDTTVLLNERIIASNLNNNISYEDSLRKGTYYAIYFSDGLSNFDFRLKLSYVCPDIKRDYKELDYSSTLNVGSQQQDAGSACSMPYVIDGYAKGYSINLEKDKKYKFIYRVTSLDADWNCKKTDMALTLLTPNSLTGSNSNMGIDVVKSIKDAKIDMTTASITFDYTADNTATYKLLLRTKMFDECLSDPAYEQQWSYTVAVMPDSDYSYRDVNYLFSLAQNDIVSGTIGDSDPIATDAITGGGYAKGYTFTCDTGRQYLFSVSFNANIHLSNYNIYSVSFIKGEGELSDFTNDSIANKVFDWCNETEKTYNFLFTPRDSVVRILIEVQYDIILPFAPVEYQMTVADGTGMHIGDLTYSDFNYERHINPGDTVAGTFYYDFTAYNREGYYGYAESYSATLDSGKSYIFALTANVENSDDLETAIELFTAGDFTGNRSNDCTGDARERFDAKTQTIYLRYKADTTASTFKLLVKNKSWSNRNTYVDYTLSLIEISDGLDDISKVNFNDTLELGIAKSGEFNMLSSEYFSKGGYYVKGYTFWADSGATYKTRYATVHDNGTPEISFVISDSVTQVAENITCCDATASVNQVWQAERSCYHRVVLFDDLSSVTNEKGLYSIIIDTIPALRDSVPDFTAITLPFSDTDTFKDSEAQWLRSIDDFPVYAYKVTIPQDSSIVIQWQADNRIHFGIYAQQDSMLQDSVNVISGQNIYRQLTIEQGTYYLALGSELSGGGYVLNISYESAMQAMSIVELIESSDFINYDTAVAFVSGSFGGEGTALVECDDRVHNAVNSLASGQKVYASSVRFNVDATNGVSASFNWNAINCNPHYSVILYRYAGGQWFITSSVNDFDWNRIYNNYFSSGIYALVALQNPSLTGSELFNYEHLIYNNTTRSPIAEISYSPALITVAPGATDEDIKNTLAQQVSVNAQIESSYSKLFFDSYEHNFSYSIPANLWTVYDDSAVAIAQNPSSQDYYFLQGANRTVVVKFARPVTGITVAPKVATMRQNSSVTLLYQVVPLNAKNKLANWYSDNTSVATVTGTGVVTGRTGGTAHIIAVSADGEYRDTCVVTVASKSSIAELKTLTVSDGVLNPVFYAADTAYTVDVLSSVESVSITAAAMDDSAHVSGDLGLHSIVMGNNIFVVRCTSEDSSQVKNYQIAVRRVRDSLNVVFYPRNPSGTFTVRVTSGDTVTAPADPTYLNHVFEGWYTDSLAFDALYDFATPVAANMSLYAKWTTGISDSFNVAFYPRNPSGTFTVRVASGDAVTAPANPAYLNHVFEGWYTDSLAFDALYDFAAPVATNTSLYAKWTTGISDSFNVVFYPRNPSGAFTVRVASGDAVTAPANPTYLNHVFEGWYTDSLAFDALYDFAAPVAANTSLYAKWTGIILDVEVLADAKNGLRIYPNPVPAGAALTLHSPTEGAAKLYSIDGHFVQNVALHKGENTIRMNVTGGVYFVRVADSSGKVLIGKIVVQ
jgi:uncharacterized repeat protein (TIGR02543 family)